MTRPDSTVSLEASLTVPTVRPAAVIALFAAFSSLPTTDGTVTLLLVVVVVVVLEVLFPVLLVPSEEAVDPAAARITVTVVPTFTLFPDSSLCAMI